MKARHLCLALGLTVSLLVPGCQRDAPAAAAPGPAVDKVPEQSRRLALLKPDGGRPVDLLIEQAQAAATRNPGKIDLWVTLGQAWVRKARETGEPGYYLNADACADAALALDADNPLAMDLRGLVALNDHRFAAARELAQQSLSRHHHDPMAFGTLSDAHLELGSYDEAVAALERMMELKPSLPSYARASYLAWLRGDGRTARQAIHQAIDASPVSRRDPEPRAWALSQAAMLFWHEGDYDGADAGFKMALETFPDYAPALVGRARVLLARRQGQDAAALLSRAFQLSPLPETAWLLGDARQLAGDDRGVGEAYELVLRSGRRADPRTLALFFATLDRDHDAAVQLMEEERKGRGDIYTQDAYAFALYRAGRLAEARVAMDEAMRLGTRDARLLYHAGAIHLATGDGAGGKRLLREALQLNPKFDLHGAADASRLLATR